MKALGVVATHSPIATSILEEELRRQFRTRFGDAPPVPLIINAQHGHSMEMAVRRRDFAALVRLATSAAHQCRAAGAEGVILGGGVLHAACLIRGMQPLDLASSALPEAVAFDSVRCIGIIGTRLDEEVEYWRSAARPYSVSIHVPDIAGRSTVESILRQQMSTGRVSEDGRTALVRICSELQRQGADVLISAVPELKGILRPEDADLPLVHAVECQVSCAIAWSTGVPVPRG